MGKNMNDQNVEAVRKNGNIKKERGAITLYVLISMLFFLVIILGIYFNTSNKMQKQEKEMEKIQKEYEKNNINDIYEEKYEDYINAETPTIQVYDGDTLKSEVIGEKVSSKKNIYLANEKVTLKFLSKNSSDKYAYSITANGEKTKVEGNTLDIDITTSGKTIYVYIEDNEGNYSKHYTAVTLILVTLEDKTIYVEEGKEIQIGEIKGVNAGNITFGQIEDSTIIKLEGDTVTALKAGTTTLIATEDKAGAKATITVKVVKIELATTSGTILVGEARIVKITGTNNGTLSIKTSDEQIATVSINNDEIIITAKEAGDATITLTESNVNATATYELKVASVALTPNGGIYTMPTEGKATIKTTVTTENAEKIEVAWSDNAGEWSAIENNELVEKTDCTNGTYYLYVRINGDAIYKSKEFIVGENTLEINKIIITPSTTSWTNGNVTATVTYGSTLTLNKKAGYGTSLSAAQSAASTSTSTSLTATENGYFYAEATDSAGNKVTATLQISNIDKTAPTVTYVTNGNSTVSKEASTVVNVVDNLSGVKQSSLKYLWTTRSSGITSGSFTGNTSGSFTAGQEISIPSNVAGDYYLWICVEDNVGNQAIVKSNKFSIGNIEPEADITLSTEDYTKDNVIMTISPYAPTVLYDNGYILATNRDWLASSLPSNDYANKKFRISGSVHTILTSNANITTGIGFRYNIGVDTTTWAWRGAYNITTGNANTETEFSVINSIKSDYQGSLTPWIQINKWSDEYEVEYKNIKYEYFDYTKISSVTVNGTKVELTEGVGTYTVTENGTYTIVVTDIYGNSRTFTKTVNNIDKTLPTVTLSPNGGTYTMPTSGNATIKTTLTASDTGVSGLKTLEYAWSTSNTEEPTSWTTFTSGSTVSKTDCTAQNYYLWTNVIDNAGNTATSVRTSSAFTVKANTDSTSKITITPSKTSWTNGNVTATVTYGSTLTSNKKAGYGTSLSAAQSAASTSTATSLTATANGYFYAEATDAAGNKITASLQVSNIDKTAPTVTLSPNGGTYTMPTSGNATIKTTLTAADTGGSGLKTLQYAWSTSNTTTPTSWTTFTSGSTVSKTNCTAGTYYLWTNVIDNAGTTATSVRTSSAFTVKANTDSTSKITITPSTTSWTNGNVTATVTYGSTLTSNKKAGYGTSLSAAQSAASTSTATSLTATANGYFYAEATDAAGNKITASLQVSNIDKTAPTVTLSPNGGTYTMPTSGNATIKTTLTAADTGGSGLKTLQYAWSTSNSTTPTSWTTFTSGSTVSKTNCTAGTYYLWTNVIDNAGTTATSVRTSSAFTVKANTDSTSKITITPSKTSWTNGNVTATVTYGSTLTSNKKAGYGTSLSAAQSAASTSTATSLTVTANGYVFASATDTAGNVVTASLQITNIDKTAPDNATITISNTVTTPGTAITAKVTHTDSQSGVKIASCKWVYNTTSSAIGTTASNYTGGTFSSNPETITLSATTGGTYYLHVLTTDVAGNVKETISTAIIELEAGDYIAYTPDKASTTSILSELETYSGSTSNTTDTLIQESLNWRVLDIKDGKVRLISETPTESRITLYGAKGYNNAVYLLDKTCSTLYNNSTYVEKVQSLKIEDIQEHLTYDYTQYENTYEDTAKYGETKTYTNSDYIYYPNLFAKEKTGWVDEVQGTELDLSEQTTPIDETSTQAGTSIKATQTKWHKSMVAETDFTDSIYYNLFIHNGTNLHEFYWISSRCVHTYYKYAVFGVHSVYAGSIGSRNLYYSDGDYGSDAYALRPVITLKTNIKIDTTDTTKDGTTAANAYVLK